MREEVFSIMNTINKGGKRSNRAARREPKSRRLLPDDDQAGSPSENADIMDLAKDVEKAQGSATRS